MRLHNFSDNMPNLWHNLRTGEVESRPNPIEAGEAKDYIPQSGTAQTLFDVCLEMDMSPTEAMTCVSKASLPALDGVRTEAGDTE